MPVRRGPGLVLSGRDTATVAVEHSRVVVAGSGKDGLPVTERGDLEQHRERRSGIEPLATRGTGTAAQEVVELPCMLIPVWHHMVVPAVIVVIVSIAIWLIG